MSRISQRFKEWQTGCKVVFTYGDRIGNNAVIAFQNCTGFDLLRCQLSFLKPGLGEEQITPIDN